MTSGLGPRFPRLLVAVLLEEMSYFLLVHVPGYFAGLGAAEGAIGVLYGLAAVLSLASRPWLGRILDLRHRRIVWIVSALINVGLLLALAFSSTWGPYLWAVFLLLRMTQVIVFTTMLTYGADLIPIASRTQGIAILGLAGLGPIAISGYVGDVLIALAGFEGVFYLAALLSGVSWVIVWGLPTLPVRVRRSRRTFWTTLGQRNLLPLWCASLMFSVGLVSVFTFARTLIDSRQVGTAGLFFASYGIAAVVTRIVGGGIFRKVQYLPLLAVSLAAYGLGLVMMAFAQSTPLLILAAIATGVAHGVIFPSLMGEVVNRARLSERGSAMATFTSIGDIAFLAGAPLVGVTIERIGYLAAFLSVGVAVLVGSVVYGQWDRRTDPATRVPEDVFE